MAAFLPRFFRLMTLAVLGLTSAAGAAEPEAINVNAGSLFIDTPNNRLLLRPVEFRQGAMSVRADEASINGVEVSFSNSDWHFSGAVRITFEGGALNADEGTARFVANRLQSARVTGTPATFSHQGKEGEPPSRGRATTIDYSAQQSRLVLTGDVWLTKGRGEFATRAPLTYNLIDRSVSSSEPVHIIVGPDALPEALKKARP